MTWIFRRRKVTAAPEPGPAPLPEPLDRNDPSHPSALHSPGSHGARLSEIPMPVVEPNVQFIWEEFAIAFALVVTGFRGDTVWGPLALVGGIAFGLWTIGKEIHEFRRAGGPPILRLMRRLWKRTTRPLETGEAGASLSHARGSRGSGSLSDPTPVKLHRFMRRWLWLWHWAWLSAPALVLLALLARVNPVQFGPLYAACVAGSWVASLTVWLGIAHVAGTDRLNANRASAGAVVAVALSSAAARRRATGAVLALDSAELARFLREYRVAVRQVLLHSVGLDYPPPPRDARLVPSTRLRNVLTPQLPHGLPELKHALVEAIARAEGTAYLPEVRRIARRTLDARLREAAQRCMSVLEEAARRAEDPAVLLHPAAIADTPCEMLRAAGAALHGDARRSLLRPENRGSAAPAEPVHSSPESDAVVVSPLRASGSR